MSIFESFKTFLNTLKTNNNSVLLEAIEHGFNILTEESNVFWHGSPSGDLRGGKTGLHVGTYKAAKQALEARIGIPAEGEWDGTREYGKTLLAGKETLKKLDPRGYNRTGFNVDAPNEDYYPAEGKAKYSDGSLVPLTSKPSIQSFFIKGKMTNTPSKPHEDFRANALMGGQLKKGTAKSGYYYKNVGEDEGSISAVVPSSEHIERTSVNEAIDKNIYKLAGSEVSGLKVREQVPNTNSISATFTNYEVLPGIREFLMSDFEAKPTDLFYSKSDLDRVRNLAEQIKLSKEINPLIVAVDKEGPPYILEGGHRLGALYLLGVNSFPALVVIDKD
jgi:hypothetical protein